jgi:hypothetical protein
MKMERESQPVCLTEALLREPYEMYREKAKEYLSSHQLADFRKCPALYHKKRLGLLPNEDRPAYLLGHTYLAVPFTLGFSKATRHFRKRSPSAARLIRERVSHLVQRPRLIKIGLLHRESLYLVTSNTGSSVALSPVLRRTVVLAN